MYKNRLDFQIDCAAALADRAMHGILQGFPHISNEDGADFVVVDQKTGVEVAVAIKKYSGFRRFGIGYKVSANGIVEDAQKIAEMSDMTERYKLNAFIASAVSEIHSKIEAVANNGT